MTGQVSITANTVAQVLYNNAGQFLIQNIGKTKCWLREDPTVGLNSGISLAPEQRVIWQPATPCYIYAQAGDSARIVISDAATITRLEKT